MVLLSQLTLPGASNKTPIVQLKAPACVKWLNPKRQSIGLSTYPLDNVPQRPSVEDLRNEIIDAIQKGTYEWYVQCVLNTIYNTLF